MIATTAIASRLGAAGRRELARCICLLVLVIWLGSAWLAAQGSGGAGHFIVPGDAKAGMQAFFNKGCIRCHSVLGEGGKRAPDLARAPAGHLGAAELVAAMWNHAPQMWQRMQQEKVNLPAFTEAEMTNLFAFLYSVRSLDEPGDAERGRRLLFEKQCLHCHAVEAKGTGNAPDLRQWASYRNPVSWIQAMWNHAPQMQTRMEARGLPWPELKESDVADLIAYIRTQATNARRHVYLEPANSDAGKALFRQKGCAHCHSLRDAAGAGAVNLGRRALPRTLGQFAAQMWNHSPVMWASMQAQQIARPRFSNKEMADLVAYLFSERYFERSGNAMKGSQVFEVKGCAACHAPSGRGSGPALTGWQGRVSPAVLATALWNHGPAMLGQMQEQHIPWPVFRPGEVVDLMEYLHQGAPEARAVRQRR